MKNCIYTCSWVILLLVSLNACSEDDGFGPDDEQVTPATAKVSGFVRSIDTQSIATFIPRSNVVVVCGVFDKVNRVISPSSDMLQNEVDFVYTQTDVNGYYEFKGLPPVENWFVGIACENCVISAMDESPDVENTYASTEHKIRLELYELEHDADNNFVIKN